MDDQHTYKESRRQYFGDDTWVDNSGREIKKKSRQRHAMNENDIAVMRGVARSGALDVQREIGGLYSPRHSFPPCGDLPATPTAYLSARGLYKCGLPDLTIGQESEVVIHWSPQLIHKAFRRRALVWHTHPDYPDPEIIHMPPSVMDCYVGLQAALDMRVDVDQLIVTRRGLWRLYTRFDTVVGLPQEQLEDKIFNFQYYAASIQTDEHIRLRNTDQPLQKLEVSEFVNMMNRNIAGFQVEYHSFDDTAA